MLPRRSRLTRHTFQASRGQNRVSSTYFSIVSGPSKNGGSAAVISKAVAKKAVERHLLKRRILSVLASWTRTDRYVVVYAKSGSPTLSFKLLSEELTGLLARTLR